MFSIQYLAPIGAETVHRSTPHKVLGVLIGLKGVAAMVRSDAVRNLGRIS
jgi:hypothetical protein